MDLKSDTSRYKFGISTQRSLHDETLVAQEKALEQLTANEDSPFVR